MACCRNTARLWTWLLVPALANAETTERVSVDSSGVEGDGDCKWSGVTDDGRYVVFDSAASNLVASDTNGVIDVFLRDMLAGTTILLSVDAAGVHADGESNFPAITPDGRSVVFASAATNLVAGDLNGLPDIFLRDLQAGTIERISVDSSGAESDGNSTRPGITPDGRFISFYSNARNLVSGDTNNRSDVFVVDRQAGTTERASFDSNGVEGDRGSFNTSMSADGRYVAFSSDATNLVAGDSNGRRDIFLRDRQAGTTTRISVDSSGNEVLNGTSESPRFAADGGVVAFASGADLLVPGDTNGLFDIFVRDLQTGTTELISANSSGATANDDCLHPRITADGRFVAFESAATDLIASDTNGKYDFFVHDRVLGTTQRISVDSSDLEADGDCHSGWISSNGAWATFYSVATNLIANDTNGKFDIFRRHICLPASWSNYGAGFPGALGVPALTLRADPVLGTTVTADLGDSTGIGTIAVVLIGNLAAQIPTRKGGDLLLVPFTSVVITVPAGGTTLVDDIPDDEALCGLTLYVQALELDAAAAKGVSFTAGLLLEFGR